MECLAQSSRIFEELEFSNGCTYLQPEKFEIFEEYFRSTGSHVKKLVIKVVIVDPQILQKLLNFLPNLRALQLNCSLSVGASDEPIKWDPKPAKIERVKIGASESIENFLESLEKCAIKELKIDPSHRLTAKFQALFERFLMAQQKNLKSLSVSYNVGLPVDLKDLRLEQLEFAGACGAKNISLEFLKQQKDLKSLKLTNGVISDQVFNVIWELKKLRSLELDCPLNIARPGNLQRNLDNLHKLEKLKVLQVHKTISQNILDHLKFGIFQNLEELDAAFKDASVESIQEMKQITPNLKKLKVHSASSDTINALLESLEKLESLEIRTQTTWQMSLKKYPKMKHIHIYCGSHHIFIYGELSKLFPNLESACINDYFEELTKPYAKGPTSYYEAISLILDSGENLQLKLHENQEGALSANAWYQIIKSAFR